MKSITYWQIYIWDGGDRHNPGYCVSDQSLAIDWKQKNPNDSVVKTDLIIFDSLKEIEDFKSGETKRRALAKLTLDEKRALGLI
jgi:hypothetical protein